jgi:hypothetical protein
MSPQAFTTYVGGSTSPNDAMRAHPPHADPDRIPAKGDSDRGNEPQRHQIRVSGRSQSASPIERAPDTPPARTASQPRNIERNQVKCPFPKHNPVRRAG